MKNIFLTLFMVLVLTQGSTAQNYQKTKQGLKTTVAGNVIELQIYSPETIRVVKYPTGKDFNKESLSVIAKPQSTPFQITDKESAIILKTKKIIVTIDTKTGSLTFHTTDGGMLLKEKNDGVRFTPFDDSGVPSYIVHQSFELDKGEPIYGLGQHQRGNLSQRNQNYRLEQGNLDDVVPFFQSIKGYGIFWDNYSPTDFKDDTAATSFTSDVGDGIDYYFMYGATSDGVIGQMRTLTGIAPMFPLWTFGYWQSKERYKSQQEIVDVIKEYRRLGVPLDGIIQDWQYWGSNYLWNSMDFLNADFNKPQKMIDEIHALNAHFAISIWSSFGPMTKQFRELKEKKMLLNFKTWPETGYDTWPADPDYPSGVLPYDPYNPEARAIYWRYLNAGLFSKGIDGWWMDSTEPDHMQAKPSDYDNQTYLGSFRKVRNAYPLMSVGGVYTNQRAAASDKRVFILTRSAFAGQQRYGANTWSGDTNSSWQTLRQQIPAGLNFSLSAIPYWNSDIGGFFLGNYKNATTNPEYKELYTRWLAFGTFCPMMRSHGTDAPREIYQFGKKGDRVYDAIEKFINLRYSLLPYIYSASRDVTAHNSSMMRALFMDFKNDSKTWDNTQEYMFGKFLLINPVTQPMYTDKNGSVITENYSSAKSQETYLPEGSDWYDFWSNTKFEGGRKVSRETPLDIIPVYVKAGAILPVGPNVQFAKEKKWDNLTMKVYPGADGTFTLYEDEFDNYNYEKGAYSEIEFNWNEKQQKLTINARTGTFKGITEIRNFTIVLPDGKSKLVNYNGKKTQVVF
ncbi:TIM-barrel domain-containing protein [Flavobacterium sp. HJJ]|uniref:TIM-barrel domain-containing protein n=1 Tax=Flavobacterium sp. HJJ TaxID=2783792 RepID=UPI00188A7F09|nr:TIM-barrel domain-containing protein [Flavobacterium sp. HJJ]MBF4473481.1 DUF5110 domain-containing protein [Flavobacterium sp. HJJ]